MVGSYPDKDLAVLKINAPMKELLPLQRGDSRDLQVGQKVFAIGNPFGLDQTLTTGIISALGREIESLTNRPIKDVIQTDAAINPGNSGGPLLDSSGKLIGVNTAILSRSGSSAGIGFAIPVDEVKRVVPQLIGKGRISRAGLGVVPAPDQVVRRLRETDRLNRAGVLIAEVKPGSPAEKAGLKPTYVKEGRVVIGDLIVQIDDKPIAKVNDLLEALEKHKAGEKVPVRIVRDDQEMDLQIELYDLK
jgi:S1-C subfamily serine protease